MSIQYEGKTTAAPQWYEISWQIIEPKTESKLATNFSMIQLLVESDTSLFLDWNSSKVVKFWFLSFLFFECTCLRLLIELSARMSEHTAISKWTIWKSIAYWLNWSRRFVCETVLFVVTVITARLWLVVRISTGCTKSAVTKLIEQATFQLFPISAARSLAR